MCEKTSRVFSVGVVGARGYVGSELLDIIASHPQLQLAFASSRSAEGEAIPDHAHPDGSSMQFEALTPPDVSDRGADVLVLALPDGAARSFVSHLRDLNAEPRLVVDLSADHRFDDGWVYGFPEHNAGALADATRVSNPGCYATACQLALRPVADILAETPHCFGVSGYSGAGRKSSPRNDPRVLAEGVLPYALVHHTHEREITRHLGRAVRFSPHVAAFFRGISVTVQARLEAPIECDELTALYEQAYRGCPLVEVIGERVPRVQDITATDGACIGGISVNPERPDEIAAVCTLDNLRKGAATQAIQNINIALGLPQHTGLDVGVHEGIV